MEEVVLDCLKQLAADYEKQFASHLLVPSCGSSPLILTPKETSEPSPTVVPDVMQPPIHGSQDVVYPNHTTVEHQYPALDDQL
jgi:hypothetical protein